MVFGHRSTVFGYGPWRGVGPKPVMRTGWARVEKVWRGAGGSAFFTWSDMIGRDRVDGTPGGTM